MAVAKLTSQEIDELRERLTSEREELAAQLTTIEDQAFAATQSDMSGDVGVDDESADAGTATFEREKELSIEQNVRDLIQKIDRALKRIEDGTYGICVDRGEQIPVERLEAIPWTTLCIDCKRLQERR
jgi:RNA polymerase-binding transcription factor